MKSLAAGFAGIVFASSTPALAWTLQDDGSLPFISQPDHSGQFELKFVCNTLTGSNFLSFATNEIWSDASDHPAEGYLAFQADGEQHGEHAFAIAAGRNTLLSSHVVELTMYEMAVGWVDIVLALPVASTMVVEYNGQTIEFDVQNYSPAAWDLYDACNR